MPSLYPGVTLLLPLLCSFTRPAMSSLDMSSDMSAFGCQHARDTAKTGTAEDMFDLGFLLANGIDCKKDVNEAVVWYKKAARAGSVPAMNHLAIALWHGEGARQDQTKALKWFKRAAKQGNTRALDNLGRMYRDGDGVKKDTMKAYKYFYKAAKKGDAKAQNNLAYLLHYMADQDAAFQPKFASEKLSGDAVAVYWYKKAAEQGYTVAMDNLAALLSKMGNHEMAFKWYKRAAKDGDPRAMNDVASMLRDGAGVTKDTNKAIQWYRKAVAQGNKQAKANLDALLSSLTADAASTVQQAPGLQLSSGTHAGIVHSVHAQMGTFRFLLMTMGLALIVAAAFLVLHRDKAMRWWRRRHGVGIL